MMPKVRKIVCDGVAGHLLNRLRGVAVVTDFERPSVIETRPRLEISCALASSHRQLHHDGTPVLRPSEGFLPNLAWRANVAIDVITDLSADENEELTALVMYQMLRILKYSHELFLPLIMDSMGFDSQESVFDTEKNVFITRLGYVADFHIKPELIYEEG